MKSEKKFLAVVLVFGFFVLAGVGVMLYMKDSKTAPQTKGTSRGSLIGQQAKIVRAYIVNFCMEYARYPSKKEFAKRYPKLAVDPDWSYSPGKDLKSGTLQYPTPLFSASSSSNTETNPCQVFTKELL